MRLRPDVLAAVDASLADDDARRQAYYPGPPVGRQPVHTAYISAEKFHEGTLSQWGSTALKAMETYGPLPEVPVASSGKYGEISQEIEAKVRAKLSTEPIEDVRIDFEDGYGLRPDAEEDKDVHNAATAVKNLIAAGDAPPFLGIRMKSFDSPALRARAIRTLDGFLDVLCSDGGAVPDGFRVTLPKVTSVAQVRSMVTVCTSLESAYSIEPLQLELQIETPQAILDANGIALVAPMIHATGGRCIGLHYGTYDYSASVGVAAAFQSMEHPAADYAKAVMQVAAAGTGVAVSDGSTNIIPVGTNTQVHSAWLLHARLVQRSLVRGFYQGWDLHPHQLPTRYAATYAFYRNGMLATSQRLTNYLSKADSGVIDEPATAAAMAGYLVRGLDCGAVTEDEVQAHAGVDRAALTALMRRE